MPLCLVLSLTARSALFFSFVQVRHWLFFFVSRKLRHWVLCCFLFLFARMDTLQRHMPAAGQDGVEELLKIAWRFEEKIFQAATDQVNSLSLSVGKH
jgi:hypothetical protein